MIFSDILTLAVFMVLLALSQAIDGTINEPVHVIPPFEVNGVSIPRVGFGTAGLRDNTEESVKVALESG